MRIRGCARWSSRGSAAPPCQGSDAT
jgi:hypothetical protein